MAKVQAVEHVSHFCENSRDIELTIEGLTHYKDDKFMLFNVPVVALDEATIAKALGIDSKTPTDVVFIEQVVELAWKHNLTKVLMARIKT